jgi:hypothetical protein
LDTQPCRMASESTSSEHANPHDFELWITSKLSTEWSAERIASQINEETLERFLATTPETKQETTDRFGLLPVPVKLRLLMSVLSLKKTSLQHNTKFAELYEKLLQVGRL